MRVLVIILFLLVSHLSFASPQKIEIDSKLFFNGYKIGAPRILAESGRKAKVIMNDQKRHKEYNLEVYPVVRGQDVDIKYALAIREQGEETLSRGTIQLKEERGGKISLDKGKIQIHLKVKSSET